MIMGLCLLEWNLYTSSMSGTMRDMKYIRCALLNSGSTVATNRFNILSMNAANNVRYRTL